MNIYPKQKRTWAEVDLSAARFNYETVRAQVRRYAKVCCVIKANAYGHGAVRLARLYAELGADYFAVANVEEALVLREAQINTPILVLGYTDPECADILAGENISQCVFSEEYAQRLSDAACKAGVSVKVHIKVDTGMRRLGFKCCDGYFDIDAIERAYKMESLIPEGIFTHFASADEGDGGMGYTQKQFERFTYTVEKLRERGCKFLIRHCANSAAVFEYEHMHLDMVRAGIVLYGVLPSAKLKNKPMLRPVMYLKTVISHIKTINAGEGVSYGRDYIASKSVRLATLPIGYADGLMRSSSKNGIVVEVRGKHAPVIGRICMDQCMIDVTDIPEAQIGSEVTVYGDGECSVNRVAEINGTINYEVLSSLGARVPRIYITEESSEDNKI